MEHHAQMSQNLIFLCRYYKFPFSQPRILYVQKMGDFPECLCQEVRKGKTLPADLSKLGTPSGLIVSGPEGILEPHCLSQPCPSSNTAHFLPSSRLSVLLKTLTGIKLMVTK